MGIRSQLPAVHDDLVRHPPTLEHGVRFIDSVQRQARADTGTDRAPIQQLGQGAQILHDVGGMGEWSGQDRVEARFGPGHELGCGVGEVGLTHDASLVAPAHGAREAVADDGTRALGRPARAPQMPAAHMVEHGAHPTDRLGPLYEVLRDNRSARRPIRAPDRACPSRPWPARADPPTEPAPAWRCRRRPPRREPRSNAHGERGRRASASVGQWRN